MRSDSFLVRFSTVIVMFIAIGTSVHTARADDEMENLRQLWHNESYREVILRAGDFRRKPFRRTAELDYIIGTSLCKLDHRDRGIQFLRWCLKRYPLSKEARKRIKEQIRNCGGPKPPIVIVMLERPRGPVGVDASLKTYHGMPRNVAIRDVPIETVRQISDEELWKRRTNLSEPQLAVDKATNLAGSGYAGEAHGRFVIVSPSSHDRSATGQALQRYEAFFRAQYGLELPQYIITVYLMTGLEQMREFAASVHGFQLPPQCIGYSHRDDLSLVIFSPGALTGTLFHELFHLMARSTFGDIPPWLDEGMAALYEVSRIDGDRVAGMENWRRRVLNLEWESRPSLAELVEMDWEAFSPSPDDAPPSRQAANEATARYFMLYLQERGQLTAVFNAIRQWRPNVKEVVPGETPAGIREETAVRFLEEVLQRPVAEIDQNFVEWFRQGPDRD